MTQEGYYLRREVLSIDRADVASRPLQDAIESENPILLKDLGDGMIEVTYFKYHGDAW